MLDLVLDSPAAFRSMVRRTRAGLPRLPSDRRIVGVLVAAAVVVLTGTVVLVAVLLRAPEGLAPLGVGSPPNAVDNPPETHPPSGEPTPSPSGSPSPTPTPSPQAGVHTGSSPRRPPAAPTALTARYATEESTLVNYIGSVAIANPGRATTVGWTVTITLPRQTLTVGAVAGAKVRRDGANWIFEPDQSTRQVPAGGSVRLRFRVDGTTVGSTPTACTIDGHPCAGVPS
jgi:hypothetical protein